MARYGTDYLSDWNRERMGYGSSPRGLSGGWGRGQGRGIGRGMYGDRWRYGDEDWGGYGGREGGFGGRGTYSGGWYGGAGYGTGNYGGWNRGGYDRGFRGFAGGGADRWDTEEGFRGGYGTRGDFRGRERGEDRWRGGGEWGGGYRADDWDQDRDVGDRLRDRWRGLTRSARGWLGHRGRGYDRGW